MRDGVMTKGVGRRTASALHLNGSGVVTALPQNKHLMGCVCLIVFIFPLLICIHNPEHMRMRLISCMLQFCGKASRLIVLRSWSQFGLGCNLIFAAFLLCLHYRREIHCLHLTTRSQFLLKLWQRQKKSVVLHMMLELHKQIWQALTSNKWNLIGEKKSFSEQHKCDKNPVMVRKDK